jgi:hypothetical protein
MAAIHSVVCLATGQFLQIEEFINRNLKPPEFQKHTRLKIYNTLALPTLLNYCETYAIGEEDKYKITSAKIKLMIAAKYTWQDYKPMKILYQNLKLTQL